jgi:cell division protein ZapA
MGKIQVDIYGQTYSIKETDDPSHIRELAVFVDAKMKEVEKRTGTIDPLRVAILTALTIADDLSHTQRLCQDLEALSDNASKRLLQLTENVL